ncbi:L-threonylcarbamoyladenylate synthase [Bacteroidota bacterium]
MDIVNKDELFTKKRYLTKRLKESIFIYPTDTIYGIGCNAENKELVNKLRLLKKRFGMPFSIIVPSLKWIETNCDITPEAEKWMEKLPGPYTLVMNLTDKKAVASNVNLDGKTIGVRIPDNWFSKIVSDMEVPIVTTSANMAGQNVLSSIEDLDPMLKKGVEFFIDDGEIQGKASTLVMLDKPKTDVIKRD